MTESFAFVRRKKNVRTNMRRETSGKFQNLNFRDILYQ